MLLNRRDLLKTTLAAALGLSARPASGQQADSLAGRGDAGTLRDPRSAGRPRDPATEADNDETVKAIEHRLQCTCGCTLDVFTCRTTDFTCTTSPAMHRQVLGLHQAGFSAEEIIQQFVDQYGEKVLMAPKPEGFNLAGYIVPGLVVLTAGTLLTLYLSRRRRVALAAAPATSTAPGAPAATPAAPRGVEASPEELERLRKALAEVES